MNDNVKAGVLTPMYVRKRRMLLMLPVLMIPFLTLAFWSLGGGKSSEAKEVTNNMGLNPNLPNPKMKNETLDKLGFYDKADKDSLKLAEEMRNDPFYENHSSIAKGNELEQVVRQSAGKYHQSITGDEGTISLYNANPNVAEQRLRQKLDELNKAMSQPSRQRSYPFQNDPSDNKLEQLRTMMESSNEQPENDTELQRLNSMMDKIIRIQHPEEFKEKKPVKNETFISVSANAASDTIVNGFYALENKVVAENANTISAVVDEEQSLVNGAIIKLRSTSDMYLREERIPAGTLIFGVAGLNGERLNVDINSIRYKNSLYPVKLQVFDLDGLPGIYVPGAITREVAKQSTDNSLQNMQLATLDPSMAAQATAAGITTLKNLLSKKIKLVKVSIKAGYQILLKNQSL